MTRPVRISRLLAFALLATGLSAAAAQAADTMTITAPARNANLQANKAVTVCGTCTGNVYRVTVSFPGSGITSVKVGPVVGGMWTASIQAPATTGAWSLHAEGVGTLLATTSVGVKVQ